MTNPIDIVEEAKSRIEWLPKSKHGKCLDVDGEIMQSLIIIIEELQNKLAAADEVIEAAKNAVRTQDTEEFYKLVATLKEYEAQK